MAANPKRITTFAQAALYTLIVIGILGAINFLANRYNKSVDTTANKRYSLSDQTIQVAKNLKQDVTITYWDLPDTFPIAKDLLDRYELLSPHMKVVYQNLEKNRTEAIAANITTRPSITVDVSNKHESAKSLTEEEVTGAIVRALKGGDRTVCFTTGYGEGDPGDPSQTDGFSGVKEITERNNYKTQVISLIPTPSIPKECTLLVVGGPKRDYLQPAVDAIQKYVEDGGRALILVDPPLKFGSQVDDNAALEAVLAGWGVKTNADLVLDLSGVGQLFGLGPELPIVTTYEDHVITRAMRNMATAFPIVRSMTATASDKAKTEALFKTSDASVATSDMKSKEIKVDPATKGARILAVAGEMNAPASSAPSTDPAGPSPSKGRFVVVGTSRWIANGFLRTNGNRDLYLNIVNWLSSDEDLIAIRPKDPENRPLNMNARQMNFMLWQTLLILPALMFLAGVSVWWRRR